MEYEGHDSSSTVEDESPGEDQIDYLVRANFDPGLVNQTLLHASDNVLTEALGLLCSMDQQCPWNIFQLFLTSRSGLATRYRKRTTEQTCVHLLLEKRHEPNRLRMLKTILTLDSNLSRVVDQNHLRPIDQLTQRILMVEERRRYEHHGSRTTHDNNGEHDFFECARALLLAECNISVDSCMPLLHACLRATNTPFSLLEISIRKFGQQTALVADENGNLPLHLAATRDPEDDDVTLIKALLRFGPTAASIRNHAGHTPLYLALSTGRTWEHGCEALFKAAPDASIVSDVTWEHVTLIMEVRTVFVGASPLYCVKPLPTALDSQKLARALFVATN